MTYVESYHGGQISKQKPVSQTYVPVIREKNEDLKKERCQILSKFRNSWRVSEMERCEGCLRNVIYKLELYFQKRYQRVLSPNNREE